MLNRCRVSEDELAHDLSYVIGGMDTEVLTDKEKLHRACYEDEGQAYDIQDHMLGCNGLELNDLQDVMLSGNDVELLEAARTLKDRLNRLAFDVIDN